MPSLTSYPVHAYFECLGQCTPKSNPEGPESFTIQQSFFTTPGN